MSHAMWHAMSHARRRALTCTLAMGFAVGTTACFTADAAPYTPHDTALATREFFFYPAADGPTHAKAIILFLGNDLGFWGAHQELAKKLAANNYNVVGFDVKEYFKRLPDDTLTRGKAFTDSVAIILKRVRAEFGTDTIPMIVGGHSIGAEVATYIASRTEVAHFKGVLLISPGARGHLRISAADLAMSGEPTEPGSFSIAENIRAIPTGVRIAIVRGTDDRYRTADSALMVAGSGRIQKWWVPWGGHSMRNILLAGGFVLRAVGWSLRID
jgi:pimeloyl-ACP methyl ester carboxylesterase